MKKIILLLITSICFFQLNAKINWTPRTSATTSIPAGVPVVITSSYTSTSNAVTVNGNVTSENGSTVTERGIVYGTAATPTLSNNKIASGAGTGTFSEVTPTLTPGMYYFRAYATNSSGTSYGAELTTTICSPNLPTLLFKLSPPDITTSAIQGQPGIRTENFNTQATGEISASGTVANGTYTKTGPADRKVAIEPNAVWGGTESQYLSLMTNAVLNITLTDASRYLGFWWGGGDDYNRVTIFGSCGGNEIQLGQFTTSSVTNLLAGATVNAVDGNSYPSASYRRANAFNQPFAFINLELSDPNVYFTRMEVTQSGGGYFEIDNITSGTVYGAATYTTPSAMTISSITAGGSLTVNFNAPSSNGGQPITNFEYSTNGGTNWVAASPVVTTSPLVISGLSIGTTYSVLIRAVNSIGYGPQSSAVNATPIAVAPVITSFTPTSAGSTATVTLTGTDFTGATAVSFGGTAATSFTVVSATSITAVLAAGTSGNVSVTTPGGTGVLAGFTFTPAPVITSFTPTSAATGSTVTLTGTNFTGATAVSFGGTAATSFTVVSATSITAVIAAGTSGNVSVTTPGGTALKAGFTFIPAPVITSFTPTSAARGATVTLTGANFTGATAVSFGGTAATSFTVVSATSITAVLAAGTSGNVSVTTPGGTGVLAGFTFIPDPPAVVCCSDLAGTYAFDALRTFCGATYSGSITLTAVASSPGSYKVSDGSFGAWAKCYGDTWGNGDVRISDDCGNLTMSGKDKYSDSYSMTVMSVTPAIITFEWRNTYGEFGTVALKSNAGKPWPVPGMIKAASSLTIDAITNQTYTGSALTPAVVVKDGATTLTLGTHYSVAYTNNRNVGTATVTITGKGNYTCTKSQTFSIVILAPSALRYTTPNVLIKDIAITSLSPTYIGVVTGFSVSPTLPAGLSINATTGVISGRPTAITASNTYVVTASNGTGSITANVRIEIVAGDTDGDGVTDTQEAIDGTDPIDACSYSIGSQILANTSAAWKAADCDGDGTPNGTDSAPTDYCVDGLSGAVPAITTPQYKFFASADCDNDGISNSMECYGGGPTCQDFDFDGIPNYLDTDSDNDGLPDSYERNIDSDKDGDADYLDLDSDNDGILDRTEGSSDADGDGIPNYLDLDSDWDGILDAWEAADVYSFSNDYGYTGTVKNADGSFPDVNGNGLADFLESSMGGTPRGPQDTDRDGIPDYLDWDSDGDYIADVLEQTSDMDKDNRPNYRDLDSDGDLISDNKETITDADGDGSPNYLDLDSDGDGIPDRVEGVVICETCPSRDDQPDGMDDRSNGIPVDTDGDGKPDYLDTDSDNDGIPDSVEAGKDPSKPVDTDGDGTPDFRDTDSDNDGIPDSVEAGKDPNKPVDTDGDGKPDYLDTDSDNDGIPDSVEAGKDPSKPVDTDGDGKPDYQDTDSDADGIPDSVEAGKDPNKPVDTDGDGKPDYQDTDSDNDGIPDSVEAGKDPSKPVDTDGDGKPDYQDTDSDNDGIPDSVEAGKDPSKPVDTDGDGKPDYQDTDSDNDGIPDSVEAGKDPNKPVDTDGDGKPDYQDTDSDNDGIPDAVEAGKDPSKPVDTDSDGKPDYLDTDSDNDGIPDAVEAGKDPLIPVDTDKDGIPDYRDLDSDGDGIPDKIEAGKDPSKPVDTDGDGKPDYQDTDSDNDGIPDAVEAGNVNNPVDTDGDGKPDYQDTDSDNDGIPDKIEAGVDPTKPVDTDGDGTPDYRDLDSDNDGYSDKEEAGKDPSNPVDTDKDGKPDYQDTDSDNDGILDKLENDINYGALADCDKDGVDNRIDADQCPTFAPNGISPNGDGKNDVLIIPGIFRNQPNELTIFNRWGNIVYQTSNYKNDWGGQTDRAFSLLSSDNLLPDGTYYYVIDFFGKYPNVGTYVYINRQEK